jgi:ATP-dependent Clp protease ATP-binding subunit ClpX
MALQCSFCGKREDDGVMVLEGAIANICEECIDTSAERIQELVPALTTKSFMRPHEIKAELDKFVVGQDEAKKILSVAVYNHYKRIHSKSKVEIQKANVLLVGPTGSGKTYLIQTLAKILNVPLAIGDATTFTEAGYIGDDVQSVLEKLYRNANGDLQLAQHGIIYIDEVDKIASRNVEGRKMTRDVAGEGVQQAFLRMIEGGEVELSLGEGRNNRQKVTFDTTQVLFVFGGAFVGMQENMQKRISPESAKRIGFHAKEKKSILIVNQENEVIPQDLIEYGMIPEFVGRVPLVATLNPLTEQDLRDILVKPKNAIIKQYQALLRMDGVKLKFNESAIAYIAEEAMKKKVGARGLRSVIEKKMYDLMYEIPKKGNVNSFTITKELLAVQEEDSANEVEPQSVNA